MIAPAPFCEAVTLLLDTPLRLSVTNIGDCDSLARYVGGIKHHGVKTDRKWVTRVDQKMKGAMKGAKVLGKRYAASRLKSSGALPVASHGDDVSERLSFKSHRSILSALSHDSILSFVSLASIGSTASILSIGSIGSILSIGSAGSILSIGSVGSILSIGKAGAAPGRGSSEPEAEILLEEVPPETEILLEEVPPETEILTEEMPPPEGMPLEPRPEP